MNMHVLKYAVRQKYREEDIHPECREMYNLVKPILEMNQQRAYEYLADTPEEAVEKYLKFCKDNGLVPGEIVLDDGGLCSIEKAG